MKKRNLNIDLIKCIAVYSVISVHYFSNIGLYKEIINNKYTIIIFFRSLFMICVPLFIITTGYLMKDKKLNKKYYLGILRVLIIYILDGILLTLYKHIYYDEIFTIRHIINVILGFKVKYSWYIEMYIGLFLIIPFINILYNNLNSKKALIITMLFMTAIPGITNIKYEFLPEWWLHIYPITYYFIGCYLKENKININKIFNIILLVLSVFLSTIINLKQSTGNTFTFGIYNDWGSILNLIPSVLVFIFVINIDLENINKKISKIIIKISELSLGIYLTSAIIDDLIYYNYFSTNRLPYFKIVPLVFLLSTSLSMIINIIYKLINKYFINKYILCFKNK